MSEITIKSPKHCAQYKQCFKIERNYKKFSLALSIFITAILLLSLAIWVILRPAKPQFSIQQVDIYQLSLSGSRINSSIQVTLLSKNPNQKVAIYYDDFQVYATYKGQQITSYTSLPPLYQDHEESNLLTAPLVGNEVPVAPSLGYEMGRDQTVGRLVLNLRVSGRLRWKVATWVTGHYGFDVKCISVMAFEPSMPSAPLTSNQGAQCSTTVLN
ncbi:NDR1/HIN1-like protein 26 [Prosopis cineraria]|uniref:NDR1/HIN1-like protein 26 n=1 Tax=Prosopis cineraria TaxID=364024 RepID=UPI00240F5557|nr:NDR1/HIN1-like protein 26 [Prosopis cineraria]XP_054794878.1 NDR1/HIN1-like protein 26 [Prosopis cineraria]